MLGEHVDVPAMALELMADTDGRGARDLADEVHRLRAGLCAEAGGELAAALRAADPPVIARIEDDRVVLDPRTVLPEQDRQLLAAIREEAGEVS